MTNILQRSISALKGWRRVDRGWPRYLPGGRIRTSTAGLVVAFIALAWLYQAVEPPPAPPAETQQVVPPGFVPDPEYTWVPRTSVREYPQTTEPRRTTTTTTPPTTTESSEPTPSPDLTTTPTTPTTTSQNPFLPTPPTPETTPTTANPGPGPTPTPAGADQ